MKVFFTPKINYRPNLGIIVPAFFPHTLMSFFTWYTFAKFHTGIKPILILYGYPNVDLLPWARRLGYKIYNVENNFNIDEFIKKINWQDNYMVTFSNIFCMRNFENTASVNTKYFKTSGKNEQDIKIYNCSINKSGELCQLSDPESRDIAYRVINSMEIFDRLDNCNKIKLSKLIKESLTFRPLIEKELSHETIQL